MTTKQLKNLKESIIKAIICQKELFGKYSFSKSIISDKKRRTLNSALFEVWVSVVAKLNSTQLESLVNNKKELIEDYKMALISVDLFDSIDSRTSDKKAVKARFEIIKNLISNYS